MSTPEQELNQISRIQICVLCQKEVSGEHPVCPYDGGPLIIKRPDRMLGKRIAGKYEVEKLLSRGGMGVIYQAKHLFLERSVAIKCIAEALSYDPSIWKRFEQEAKNASLLNHPNIITIHDFGVTEEGDLYLVMEYLEGASLNDFIELNGQISQRACARIFLQTCQALAHAHSIGILHRDLKPGNIFISSTAQGLHVKILDFGLAKAMIPKDGKEKITRTGECLGTPNYMSPEQASGSKIDQRSDIYALGVCMFEALTGKLPFSSDDLLQVMSMQIRCKVPSFAELSPEIKIDPEIESIVMKCLEKDPAKRFKSMNDICQALAHFLKVKYGEDSSSSGNSIDTKESGKKDSAPGQAGSKTAQRPQGEKTASQKNINNPKSGSSSSGNRGSRLSVQSSRITFWGFTAAAILALCTATQVLMPAQKESTVLTTVSGVLYHLSGVKEGQIAELNVDGHTLKLSILDNDAIKIPDGAGLQNGAVWTCLCHQEADGLKLDSASFAGSVDPLVRDADTLVRRHYGQLGRKQFQAAYDNIAPESALRKANFVEFKKGFKQSFHNPDSELAPAGASKIISVTDADAVILVDISQFSKGSGYYSFNLLRRNGRWLIKNVKAISYDKWRQS